MKRLVFSLLLILFVCGGIRVVDAITSSGETNSPSIVWRVLATTSSSTRAAICRRLAPIRLGWRQPLVTQSQIFMLRDQLEPGDIILTRDELKMSTHFIPGFWTHAVLYLGGRDQFHRYFSDLIDAGGGPCIDPAVWRNGETDSAAIIEADLNGVGTYPLSHLAPVDHLVVLRPLVGKETKLSALSRAWGLNGKAYDFYFDFDTQDALICSELIYHAYGSGQGKSGLAFPLYLHNGKPFMSANDIARKYAMAVGTSRQELACVLFIDGRIGKTHSGDSAAAQFRETWRRSR